MSARQAPQSIGELPTGPEGVGQLPGQPVSIGDLPTGPVSASAGREPVSIGSLPTGRTVNALDNTNFSVGLALAAIALVILGAIFLGRRGRKPEREEFDIKRLQELLKQLKKEYK